MKNPTYKAGIQSAATQSVWQGLCLLVIRFQDGKAMRLRHAVPSGIWGLLTINTAAVFLVKNPRLLR